MTVTNEFDELADTDEYPLGPILAALDEESPHAPQIGRAFAPVLDEEGYPGVEASLVKLATSFRPFVLVVTNEDGATDEVVSAGFDREESMAVLTAAIEALSGAEEVDAT